MNGYGANAQHDRSPIKTNQFGKSQTGLYGH
jgi:hypothetical protein